MKKIIMCCTAVLAVGLFTACDPVSWVNYSICNKSGHDVNIMSTSARYSELWRDNPDGLTVRDGMDTLFFSYDVLEHKVELSDAKHGLDGYVYGDTVTITFDDGKRIVYLKKEGKGVFDYEGEHYSWKTEGNGNGLSTYTIIEEDYNSAQ